MHFKFFIIPLLFILSGCSTMSINSDYNPDYNFKKLKTFHILAPSTTSANTLVQDRIAKALVKELEQMGYALSSEKFADFFLLFKTDVTQKQQSVIEYRSVGYYQYVGNNSYLFPLSVPVRQNYVFDEQKIVFNAIDPDTKKVFWEAVAVDKLRELHTPSKRMEYITQVVHKSFATFPVQSSQSAR